MTRMSLVVLLSLPVCAYAEALDGFVTRDRLPDPEHAALLKGGVIWESTCQNCHGGNKLTGAPKVTHAGDWAPRIEQGLDVLFDHAINGFIGPKYKEMPSRGGNADLNDDEVKAAVAFMIWASGGADVASDWAATQDMGKTE